MSTFASRQNTTDKSPLLRNSPNAGLLLQRKCAFGLPKSSLTSEYEGKTRLQAKLTIGASNDPLEQEADQVADQVLAAPVHSAVSGAAPSIQRFTGQRAGGAGTAPASVDRVLSGSGRPLDSALQQDMGQRFGHDFSRVRVHNGSDAERSAQDVNAHAYTVGNNIVFGAGGFAPETHGGRRLLAHELTHVVQQKGGSPQLQRDINQAALNQCVAELGGSTGFRDGGIASTEELERYRQECLARQTPTRDSGSSDSVIDAVVDSVAGGLAGEFNEDPTFAMIGVDLGISLVPILDQASDARDIVAHLYYMTARSQYNRFMRWLGLVFSLIGLFPEIGSAIKGASKFVIKGVREVISHLADLLSYVRRFLPEVSNIARFHSFVNRNWGRIIAGGLESWSRGINRVDSALTIASRVSADATQRLRDALARVKVLAPRMIRIAFDWVRDQFNRVLDEVRVRLGVGARRVDQDVDEAVDRAFREWPGGASTQPHQTTQRLIRGNLGERLAAEALAADGHHILSYKPSIMGTNQGGIDMVTMRNGVVYLVDNKALTRSGNVSSVSALTTNFTQNRVAVVNELTAMLADVSRTAGERQMIQQALVSINSGNFIRAVTNANVTPDNRILFGVTQQLQDQGIRFINVMQ